MIRLKHLKRNATDVCMILFDDYCHENHHQPLWMHLAFRCSDSMLFVLFFRSVGFMFIFSFIFFLLTAVCLLLGVHLHILCRELKDGEILDKVVYFFLFSLNRYFSGELNS